MAKLVNGGNLEYRNPKYAFQELPEESGGLMNFFPHRVGRLFCWD